MPNASENLHFMEVAEARTQVANVTHIPWLPVTCDELSIRCDTLWITCDGGVPVMRPQARAIIGLHGLESS